MLTLDWTKASQHLGWQPVLSLSQALDLTLDWYQDVKGGKNARQRCLAQFDAYRQAIENISLAGDTTRP